MAHNMIANIILTHHIPYALVLKIDTRSIIRVKIPLECQLNGKGVKIPHNQLPRRSRQLTRLRRVLVSGICV